MGGIDNCIGRLFLFLHHQLYFTCFFLFRPQEGQHLALFAAFSMITSSQEQEQL
jgi:hypothetical protein